MVVGLRPQSAETENTPKLADDFACSAHVREVGLQRADDESVWSYAKREGLVIVSKDADFHQRSLLFGHPPKVIWVRLGNCSVAIGASSLPLKRMPNRRSSPWADARGVGGRPVDPTLRAV